MDLVAEKHDATRTTTLHEVVALIGERPGVLGIEPLDGETVGMLVDAEDSISRVSGGMRLENRGMRECARMDRVFVMFCDPSFPRPDEVTMEMVDDEGVVVGHDVPPSMRSDYEGRENVMWMADGFVMYPSRVGTSDVRLVMLSGSFDVPEPFEARVFYPSMTSAQTLCGRFGVIGDHIAAVVLGIGCPGGAQFL